MHTHAYMAKVIFRQPKEVRVMSFHSPRGWFTTATREDEAVEFFETTWTQNTASLWSVRSAQESLRNKFPRHVPHSMGESGALAGIARFTRSYKDDGTKTGHNNRQDGRKAYPMSTTTLVA